jgi:D-glycero-alpha-D-manno-heptose-7-phosphate kinase
VIISKTPFRVSFFGGGTDYPVWYREHGGSVISATIDKYCYLNCRYLPPFFEYNYRIRYTEQEGAQALEQIRHPSVRECIRHMEITEGLEVQHNADLPAQSGLGSSSSFTVGAAYGGFNRIGFGPGDTISVERLLLDLDYMEHLESHLLLFFTGFQRTASTIARHQIRNTPSRERELRAMMQLVTEALEVFRAGPSSLPEIGRLLQEQWIIKKHMSHLISNPALDEIHETACRAGALGGKLLGAGGGGFFLFFAPPERHAHIRKQLSDLVYVPVRFESVGSQIIYYKPSKPIHRTPEKMPSPLLVHA